jgi:OOP family OmpA-OmpF porin
MKSCVVLLGSVLIGSTAWGADTIGSDTVGHWYFTPQVGATFTDGSRHVDDGPFFGLGVGRNLSANWSAEVNVLTGKYDGRHHLPDLHITPVSFDVLRVFERGAVFSPYLSAGIGAIVDDPSRGRSQGNFLAQAGAGALIHLAENADGSMNFSLRPELKLRWDSSGAYGRPLDEIIGVGFQFAFGAPRATETAAAAPPAAAAPAAPVNPSPPPPAPASPPAPVAAPAQSVLPARGAITLAGVHFKNNSAQLTADSAAVLDPVAAALSAHPGVRVELQGYTDSVGSVPYNLRLSQARADAVRDYLVAHGAPAGNLTARGYGKTRPVADNGSAQGRAQNRRVVMAVLDNPDDVEIRQDGGR